MTLSTEMNMQSLCNTTTKNFIYVNKLLEFSSLLRGRQASQKTIRSITKECRNSGVLSRNQR